MWSTRHDEAEKKINMLKLKFAKRKGARKMSCGVEGKFISEKRRFFVQENFVKGLKFDSQLFPIEAGIRSQGGEVID